MNIWRLIAHHEEPVEAIELMKASDRIAIGWSGIGDLRQVAPQSTKDITRLISGSYPTLDNARQGGPSLWNLYAKMDIGDFVILNAGGRRICVFEVTGPYLFEEGSRTILGYSHQRPAVLTAIDAEELWARCGSDVADGDNIRWTLAACKYTGPARDTILTEGARFSIASTAIERNPVARRKCIEHYDCKCYLCGFDFEQVFGELGKGFIHVHHRVDLATRDGVYNVDPINDLVPLCPNCHAMAHRERPALPIERLKEIIQSLKAKPAYLDCAEIGQS